MPRSNAPSAVTAKDRRKGKMRRKEDRELVAQLDQLFEDCGTQFTGLIEHIDSEWETVERLKLETREILTDLRPV